MADACLQVELLDSVFFAHTHALLIYCISTAKWMVVHHPSNSSHPKNKHHPSNSSHPKNREWLGRKVRVVWSSCGCAFVAIRTKLLPDDYPGLKYSSIDSLVPFVSDDLYAGCFIL